MFRYRSIFSFLIFFSIAYCLLFTLRIGGFTVYFSPSVYAQECKTTDSKDSGELQKIIDACNAQLAQLGKTRQTLKDQIAYMDTQINITQLEINSNTEKREKLKKEIENLGTRIGELEKNLSKISEIVNQKIVSTYKQQQYNSLTLILRANNLPSLLRSVQYLKKSQEQDRQILLRTQNQKLNFKEQKTLREEKEEELKQITAKLENYKASLNAQQQEKEKLLEMTQNDEQNYQNILAQARAEYAAIRGIISGSGTETKIKDVTKGETVATVIQGASCNSSGTHLHFMVKDNGAEANPFNYLKGVDYENCSGPGYCSEGDSFNPSGSWDWPLDPKITFLQGYGNTWAVNNTWVRQIYSFHNGIDFSGASLNVKSVADGELYRGSYGCLPYAKIKHKDANIETFYLHVYTVS